MSKVEGGRFRLTPPLKASCNYFSFEASRVKATGPGGVRPSKRLMRMCRWMGSHFHNWTDYSRVTRMHEVAHFRDF